MVELKTKKTKASPTKFVAAIKDEKKRKDAKTLLKVFKDATGMSPKMWGAAMVGYGEYHYESTRSAQKGDWPLTGFSPRKQSLTVYIMPGFKKYGTLLKKLGPHTISGGSCIYMKRLDGVHLPTLKAIIKDSVKVMKRRYNA